MPGRPTSEVVETLRAGDRRSIVEALAALEAGTFELDASTVVACVELLAGPAKEISRRAAGALTRAAASERLRALVLDALDDADPRRRWGAAFALAAAGHRGERVLAAAVEALGLDDGDIRWAAAGIVRDAVRERPELLGAVRAAARSQPAVRRKMALYCMRDLGDVCTAADTDGAGLFVSALDDADRGVRMAALSALSSCPHAGVADVERVVACLESDRDVGLRRAAAAALGKLKAVGPSAVAALERVRDTCDDPDLVRAIALALR